MSRWHACAAAAALLAGSIASAQPVPTAADARGRLISVQLLTMGQGDEIWEKFGHNALWITDAGTGADVAWNWGMFDFAQPGFLARFLTGNTLYWMDGFPVGPTLRMYESRNRAVTAQALALTPAQRVALDSFARWNARPENRYYRYDYFLDNCSTRIRDALDKVLGGAIRRQTEHVPTGTTFRWHTQRLLEGDPLPYVGVTIALGQPADDEISAWQEMFLPVRMLDHLRRVRVDTGGGALVPLVTQERPVVTARRSPESPVAHRYTRYFLGVGVALGVVLLLAGTAAHGAPRALFTTLATGWLLLGGTIGTILVLAWAFTRHVFWYRNENLFLLNPLLLALAVMLPLAMRATASPALRRRTLGLARLMALCTLLALVLKALPWFYQRNWEVIALALPPNLAIAAVLWKSAGRRAKP